MRVALQLDHPSALNAAGDTSLAIAEEAQKRGYALYFYHPSCLALVNGLPVATQAYPLKLMHGQTLHFELGDMRVLPMHQLDVVLMRQDPPFDLAYITATYFLERLPASTRVLNNPKAVRDWPEKLSMFEFPDFIPPTLITRDAHAIREFLESQEHIVLKPLYGYGGHAVFKLHAGDVNLDAVLEYAFRSDPMPWIAQRFLPEVKDGDRRLIFIDGDLSGVLGRIPEEGQIRANLRVGGSGAAVKLSPKQELMVEHIGSWLREQNIYLAGVDFIGDYLTEINVTSPTGFRAIDAIYGTNLAAVFWDKLG